MDTVQAMVDEAAKKAGYTIKAYHGTNNREEKSRWNSHSRTFDTEYSRFTIFKQQYDEQNGFFFSNVRDNAGSYGSTVYDVYLSLKKPLTIDCNGQSYNLIVHDGKSMDTYEWASYARKNGYDGVIFKNVRDGAGYGEMSKPSTDYVAFRSAQIKSADPIAYDNAGKIIPLSKRFNPNNRDIRFALPETDSNGETLTEAQREYFAGTQVVDANGRLLRVYHGSPAIFTEFSYRFMSTNGSAEGQGFYFTQNRDMAEGFSKKGGQILDGYLDIKKPLSDSEVTLTRAEVKRLIQAIDPTGDDVVINFDSMGGVGYPTRSWYNRALTDAVNSCMDYCDTDSEILGNIANSGAGAQNVLTTVKKVLGYDGYIVEGKYDGATVYVAFTSEQFKNADNKAPTNDPDIRYALPETVEQEVLEKYGRTYSWNTTGYIFKNGTRLDLSGKSVGAPGGYRALDHRDIFDIYEVDSYTDAMIEFMARGNIRVAPESPGINLIVEPTEAQYEHITSLVERLGWKDKEFHVELDNENGNNTGSLDYEGNVSARKVVADIKYFFKEGKLPYQSDLSQFRFALTDYTKEQYNDYGWARANGVLSASENEHLRSLFADAMTGQYFPKTKSGEYMIVIGELVDNKIVYMSGKIDEPVITLILEIDEYNETKLDEIRRETYALERRGIQRKAGGIFHTYTAASFGSSGYQSRSGVQSQRYNNQLGAERGAGSGATQKIDSGVQSPYLEVVDTFTDVTGRDRNVIEVGKDMYMIEGDTRSKYQPTIEAAIKAENDRIFARYARAKDKTQSYVRSKYAIDKDFLKGFRYALPENDSTGAELTSDLSQFRYALNDTDGVDNNGKKGIIIAKNSMRVLAGQARLEASQPRNLMTCLQRYKQEAF